MMVVDWCYWQVTWRKRDEIHPLTIGMFQFAPDTRISVDYNHRTTEWSLIIQDVKPSDEGVYCCQISTKHDRDTYDIRLNVRSMSSSFTYLSRRLVKMAGGLLWTPAQRSLSEVHVMFCECYFLFIFYGRLMLRPRLTEIRETFTRGGP